MTSLWLYCMPLPVRLVSGYIPVHHGDRRLLCEVPRYCIATKGLYKSLISLFRWISITNLKLFSWRVLELFLFTESRSCICEANLTFDHQSNQFMLYVGWPIRSEWVHLRCYSQGQNRWGHQALELWLLKSKLFINEPKDESSILYKKQIPIKAPSMRMKMTYVIGLVLKIYK